MSSQSLRNSVFGTIQVFLQRLGLALTNDYSKSQYCDSSGIQSYYLNWIRFHRNTKTPQKRVFVSVEICPARVFSRLFQWTYFYPIIFKLSFIYFNRRRNVTVRTWYSLAELYVPCVFPIIEYVHTIRPLVLSLRHILSTVRPFLRVAPRSIPSTARVIKRPIYTHMRNLWSNSFQGSVVC